MVQLLKKLVLHLFKKSVKTSKFVVLKSLKAKIAVYKHGLKIGVVVSYTGDADTGKGIAMHVAAFNPVAVNAEGVLLTYR
jgi:translation elongation factor EF-Ts